MTDIDDARLMAYVDGELPAEDAARIDAQAADDAVLAERIRQARALRGRLDAAYASILDEEVPHRLRDVLRPGSEIPDPVPAAPAAVTRMQPARRPRRAREWMALAASLLLGVLIARVMPPLGTAGQDVFVDGAMRARGALATALDGGLAAGDAQESVSIGLTFRARDGGYCRSFTIAGKQPRAGLACREGGESWQVTTLASVDMEEGREMRQAATVLPSAVLAEIDARIEGDPLDATQERAARDAGWR